MHRRSLLLLLGLAAALAGCSQSLRPHIAVGGISAESNTFYPKLSEMRVRDFESREEWLREGARGRGVVRGLIETSERVGLDLYPVHSARASSLGTVSDSSFSSNMDELIRQLESADPPFDGVFLVLHGAMAVESFPHGDAEVVRRVREAMGPDVPIVVTHDFHANVAPEIVEHSDVLITYKESPHLDSRERGDQAAEIMAKIVTGQVKPVQALAKPAMLLNLIHHDTFTGVLKPIVAESRRLERENPKILAVSVPGGYQWADVQQMGPSVIVVTDGDLELAQREADRLSDKLWAVRDQLPFAPPDTAAAVRQAMESSKQPVVLMDTGDNIGGGSAGDGTHVLSEFLRQKTLGWVMSISDPEAVEAAVRAGVGQPFDQLVGAKTDELHGEPVRIRGYVRFLKNSQHDGAGLSAVIEVEGSTRDLQNLLLLTSRPSGARNAEEMQSNGIDPSQQTVIVSKGTVAPFATFRDIAGEIILANTPGPTNVDPAQFTYKNVRRPYYGLD